MDDEDFLGVLLDAATDTRVKLLNDDEARAVMMLFGVRGAAGRMRFSLGSRLALPADHTTLPTATV
ncbi:hypothetical protein [Streptomyces xanthophaeus]|uniref:hypothetical protein n=1 Tax=Streptomyces xanthophaeus TaxID=67385 RepID=UPI00233F5D6A|nr:hypothetical protein [Streptomyces xanthophaeus]